MRYPCFSSPILGALVLAIVLSNPLAAHAEDGDRWIVGHWQGVIDAGSQELRIVYHLSVDDHGKLSGTMDVPAQGAYGLGVSEVEVGERTVSMSFDVPGGGSYEGMLDDSGDRLDGTFTQGSSSLPLVLERADASVAPSHRPQQPRPPFPYAVDEVSLSNAQAGIELARHGIVALRLDDRGVGGSGGDPAAATPADVAEQRMREAAAAALDELPPEHGALARRALPDAAIDQIVRQLNSPASRFVLGHDPATALSKVQVPVLALFGGSDRQTPFDPHGTAVAAALERAGNRDAAVEAMSGLNHLLQVVEPGSVPAWADIEQTLAPRALARISGWIGERFSARDESGRSD